MDTLNPYSPPKSSVEDAPTHTNRGEKPVTVKVLTVLLWTSFGVGALTKVLRMFKGQFPYGLPPQTGIPAYATAELLAFWFTWKLTSGRNWARIIWIVLFAFELVGFVVAFRTITTMLKGNVWLFATQSVVGICVLVLLLLPPTSRWYKASYADVVRRPPK